MHSRAYYSRLIATLVNCSIELALIGPAPENDPKKKVLTIPTLNQGILTEVEGSIHLTSSLRYIVLKKGTRSFRIKRS